MNQSQPITTFALAICWCLAANVCQGEVRVAQQQVGARVIDFELPRADRDDFLRLSDEYSEGPVVVIVLRGHPGYQCPICRQQVSSLANRARSLSKQANRVILVYPGESERLKQHAKRFLGSRKLPDPLVVVRDDAMDLVHQWGLRWHARNETAYPATYVIDRNGRIRWKKVSQSHAGRSTVEEILEALREI